MTYCPMEVDPPLLPEPYFISYAAEIASYNWFMNEFVSLYDFTVLPIFSTMRMSKLTLKYSCIHQP